MSQKSNLQSRAAARPVAVPCETEDLVHVVVVVSVVNQRTSDQALLILQVVDSTRIVHVLIDSLSLGEHKKSRKLCRRW